MKVKDISLKLFMKNNIPYFLFTFVIIACCHIKSYGNDQDREIIPNDDPFLLANIDGFADVGNLEDSKTEVMTEINKKAFRNLMARISPSCFSSDIENLAKLYHGKNLIKSYKILNERMTSHSYGALYDIFFNKEDVEALLSSNGIRYSTKYSPMTLVIPILYDLDGSVNFQEGQDWIEAWNSLPQKYGLTKINIIDTSISDIHQYTIESLKNFSFKDFTEILKNYDATRLIIVNAYTRKDNNNLLEIQVGIMDGDNDIVRCISYHKKSNELKVSFLLKTAKDVLQKIDDLWKGEDLFEKPVSYLSKVYVPLQNLKTWSDIRNIFNKINAISKYSIVQSNKDYIEVELEYSISPPMLSKTLSQYNLKVRQKDDKTIIERSQ